MDRKLLHGHASMIKLYCSAMAGRPRVHILGGHDEMRANGTSRTSRELRVERIWEGASDYRG